MALYRQLKFPSTFIEYRSVSEWKGVVVISNFVSFKSTALGSCLVCLGLNSPLASSVAWFFPVVMTFSTTHDPSSLGHHGMPAAVNLSLPHTTSTLLTRTKMYGYGG